MKGSPHTHRTIGSMYGTFTLHLSWFLYQFPLDPSCPADGISINKSWFKLPMDAKCGDSISIFFLGGGGVLDPGFIKGFDLCWIVHIPYNKFFFIRVEMADPFATLIVSCIEGKNSCQIPIHPNRCLGYVFGVHEKYRSAGGGPGCLGNNKKWFYSLWEIMIDCRKVHPHKTNTSSLDQEPCNKNTQVSDFKHPYK